MTELTIVGVPQSTYVRAIRMACHEKGVSYQLDAQVPHSDAALAVHPMGFIPGLRHGDVTVAESHAIARYIDQAFDGPALFPSSVKGSARADYWVSLQNTRFDEPLIRQYLFGYIRSGTADGSPDRTRIDDALPDVENRFDVLEQTLSSSAYLVGDALSYADLNLFPMLAYVTRMPEGGQMVAARPALQAYFDGLSSRSSAVETQPPLPGN